MKENLVLKTAQEIMSVDSSNYESLLMANENYIKALTMSSSENITIMLNKILNDYYIGFPFWARLITFRTLCLLEPENINFKRWAESDISAFGGPDWENKISW